jgi:hypothetical protein
VNHAWHEITSLVWVEIDLNLCDIELNVLNRKERDKKILGGQQIFLCGQAVAEGMEENGAGDAGKSHHDDEGKTRLQRMGTPEDISNAYLLLASDEAGFITGTVLRLTAVLWCDERNFSFFHLLHQLLQNPFPRFLLLLLAIDGWRRDAIMA